MEQWALKLVCDNYYAKNITDKCFGLAPGSKYKEYHLIPHGIVNAIKYVMKMKGLLIVLFFLVIRYSTSAQENERLRYDGYYTTLGDSLNPFRYYLRFYEDGTVINYCTAGNPATLLKWFSKDDQSSLKGKYVLKDTVLNFSVKNKEGEIVYAGNLLSGNRLWMSVKSLLNKYEAKEEYFFQQADGLK